MSPQEDVSGSNVVPGAKTPLSPVCAEVRVIMDAVRDSRATPAERMFVAAHTERCAGCASEWAFLLAAKSAWGKTPMAVPSASLSARIAAATYRKPTFAERFVSAFAFLNPVPVRVAIGVAAVAGLSFLALPRLTVVPVAESPGVSDPAPILAQESPLPDAEPSPAIVASVPVEKTVPAIKKATPKPATPVVKEPPVVATKPPAMETKASKIAAVTEKPTPKASALVPKQQPTRIARNTAKPVRETPAERMESASPDRKPLAGESEAPMVAAVTPAPVPTPAPAIPAGKPEVNSPAIVARVATSDPDPVPADDSPRILNLRNTNRPLPMNLSGTMVRTSYSANSGNDIVSMPTKL